MTKAGTLAVAFFAAYLAVACSSSSNDSGNSAAAWRDKANQVNDATCDKMYECYSATTLDMMRQIEPRIGNSVDECKANFRASNAKATQACAPGKTFHASTADECLSSLSSMTCQDFSLGGPKSCSQICA